MRREFFLTTDRIGFSKWSRDDIGLARSLWGDPAVARYIHAGGVFSGEEIKKRLDAEIACESTLQVQYWPIFELAAGDFMGCCGLRSHRKDEYELGLHLRPEFWGKGYGAEAAEAVIRYSFAVLHTKKLFAGHHPDNARSRTLLKKLGFVYIGDEFYEPTGLYHPSYKLDHSGR